MTTAPPAPLATPVPSEQPLWVTLREASDAAGVSVSAIRKAYRAGRIEARDEDGPYGVQKRVRLDEVRAVVGTGVRTRSSDQHAPGSALVLLEEARRGWDAAAALHVAAQELGEARERAGRAEGEARVYAELVDELRARVALLERDLEQACATGSPRPTPAAPPASTTSSEHDDPAPARGWFGRRRP